MPYKLVTKLRLLLSQVTVALENNLEKTIIIMGETGQGLGMGVEDCWSWDLNEKDDNF